MSWSRSDAFSISVSFWITICPFLVMEKIHLFMKTFLSQTFIFSLTLSLSTTLDFEFASKNSLFSSLIHWLYHMQYWQVMRSIAFSITIKYWIKYPPMLAKYYWQKQLWRCTFFSKLWCLSVIRQRLYLTIEVNIKAESTCES